MFRLSQYTASACNKIKNKKKFLFLKYKASILKDAIVRTELGEKTTVSNRIRKRAYVDDDVNIGKLICYFLPARGSKLGDLFHEYSTQFDDH